MWIGVICNSDERDNFMQISDILELLIIFIYLRRVKKQAQERPMSLWLSSIKQLEPVKQQINPLLWDFMEVAWPSSISLVIPRGWLLYIHTY